MNHFVVIKKCFSDYDCKIHEVSLIIKHVSKLYKQLCKNGSSLLLQQFKFIHVITILFFFLFLP